ncbi:MAG TPA: type II toxin-antitoxin system HicA family toxin [Thermoanaerobacterales bacterium]|nr:type II toxin-antitoxin system HicA family toxin [Thermoanaerobacterales bacterium]
MIKSIYSDSIFIIPVHASEELDRSLLRAIIRQAGLEVNRFIKLWRNR